MKTTVSRIRVLGSLVGLAFVGTALPSVLSGQESGVSLDHYLRVTVGLTDVQVESAKHGHAVATGLPTDNSRDVTVLGVIGIPIRQATYAARMRDTRQALAGRTPFYGVIGDPVAPADLQAISIDEAEYKAVRSCKPNNCAFKLPASAMRRLSEAVDWNGRDPKGQLDSLVRETVAQFIARYRAVGNAAMVRYDDKGNVQSGDVFADLLSQSPYLRDYVPELRDYLMSYPAMRPEGAIDVLYWMMSEKGPLRPTLTLNHMVVYTPPAGPALVARKQIYANHYFEGGFELLAAIDAPASPDSEFMYLVNVRRYRYDNFPGGALFNARGRVRDGLMAAMRDDLERERAVFVPALARP